MKKGQLTTKRTDSTEQHTEPCADCPFARTALPGWLGGQSVGEWLAMAHGEGPLYCHTKTVKRKVAMCAGGAIFRANVCKSAVFRLPQNNEKVFAMDNAFASHHLKKPVSHQEAFDLKMKARGL